MRASAAARIGLDHAEVERAVAGSAALRAAEELGILDELVSKPLSVTGLAAACGASEHGLGALVDALVALGALERVDGGVRARVGAGVLAEHRRWWDRLTAVVRTGEPAARLDRRTDAAAAYPELIDVLAAHSAAAADRAAEILGKPGLHVVDIGCGAAPWSRAIVSRHPDTHLTLVDLPAVIERARRAVSEDGLEDRTRLVAGDAFEVALPDDADLVLLTCFLHLFEAERARRLVGRAGGALGDGGRLAIVEPLPEGAGRSHPVRLALYGLSLTMRTTGGGLHHLEELTAWLRDAGLSAPDRVRLQGYAGDLLIAERSGS